jgi:hypothetical protein
MNLKFYKEIFKKNPCIVSKCYLLLLAQMSKSSQKKMKKANRWRCSIGIRRGKDGRVKPCLTAWQRAAVHGVVASEQEKTDHTYVSTRYSTAAKTKTCYYRTVHRSHCRSGSCIQIVSKFVPNFIIFLGKDTEMAYHRRQANLNSVVDPHWF